MCEKNEAIEVLEDRYNELQEMNEYSSEAMGEIENTLEELGYELEDTEEEDDEWEDDEVDEDD